ncbi:MAG TPA: serine hydrolase domain-containing protein [Pseudonocardiaceae bacterium]|jgi:CubicO group peptidase (beta-lactamase class C family)|nr:serine hydrolase domain-containing protein [Pseudonocardiaceae bacterium]
MGEIAVTDLPIGENMDVLFPPGRVNSIARTGGTEVDAAPVPVDGAWLAATMTALVERHQVPGAQLAVHRGGVTVAVEVGEIEYGAGIPVTRETAFPVGSITKAWTATLAMILVADGDLELDAPLDEYLPELGDWGSQLTLGQLLSHTSGFASSPETPDLFTLSLGRYVREHCREQDLILAPGSGFSYSSRNYVLVGHLIETITGMSWWEAVESILLRPLGVDPAAVVGPMQARCERPIATGHSVNSALGRTRSVEQLLVPAEAPAGALAMSAVDLVALGLMHVGQGVAELLPATYAERMREAVPDADSFGLADGWGAGLAVFREGTTEWIGHDGNANGTSCYLRIDPASGCVVALTTNSNTGSYLWEELCAELGRANLPLGTGKADTSPRPTVGPPAQCLGRYCNGPTEYLVTAADDGGLCLAIGGELIARLAFYDGWDFVLQDPVSGQGLHVGRFLRDPITKQVEHLQIVGRRALRDRPSTVPQPRSRADSLSCV